MTKLMLKLAKNHHFMQKITKNKSFLAKNDKNSVIFVKKFTNILFIRSNNVYLLGHRRYKAHLLR